MTKGRLLAAAVVVLALLAFGGWWYFVRDTSPPAPTAEGARIALEGDTGDTAAASSSTTATTDTAGTAGDADDLSGTWQIDTTVGGDDINARTYIGYKVREILRVGGDTTAFGRTPAVNGGLTIDGTTVTEVEIEADLTELQSDKSQRDNAIRTQALETNDFPTAIFTLTQSLKFDPPTSDGVQTATALGDLTLHGVTNQVEIPIEAQLVEDIIAVSGTAVVVMADYQIDVPSSPAVESVEDEGTLELQLFFSRA